MFDMRDRQSGKPDDRIHRSTDIVGHIGEKYTLRLACPVRLHKRIFQKILLLHLLPYLGIHTAEAHDNSLAVLPRSGTDSLHLEISHLAVPQSPVIHTVYPLIQQLLF